MYPEIPALYNHYLSHPLVTTDSRNCPEGSIFFALRGDRFDGNRYATAALAQGCSLAVVDDASVIPDGSDKYFLVPDVLTALQQLSAWHRAQFRSWHRPVPVIGITGTNGKTTTKELLKAVLGRKYNVLATEGNLNNQIGVPLTLLRVTPDHDVAIVEMGANHPMDIAELCALSQPDYGLITNVGKAHLQGFGSLEGVIEAKTKLYESLRETGGTVFVDGGNPYLTACVGDLAAVTYAVAETSSPSSLPVPSVVGRISQSFPFLSLSLQIGAEQTEIHTHLFGDYNLINVLAAAAVGNTLGVSLAEIKAAVEGYTPSNMRSQLIDCGFGHQIILDAYNANPSSMAAAIRSFSALPEYHKSLVLGDMRELGEDSFAEHQAVLMQLISLACFDEVILVGTEFGKAFASLTDDQCMQWGMRTIVRCYDSVDGLCQDLGVIERLVGIVLVKGSRGIQLEKAFADKL